MNDKKTSSIINDNIINDNIINEKITASIMLGAYLDTIGFKNGKWEFNYFHAILTIEQAKIVWLDIISEYYSLGGPDLNIKNWKVSDDTMLMIATGKACLNNGGYNNYISEYLNIYDNLIKEERYAGNKTIESLSLLKKKKLDIEDLPSDQNMGGNGAAIRTCIIGIKWYNNEDKIIEESIIASRITHNLPLGFLGGMVSALFTSYAIQNIHPWLWVDKLLELYYSKKIYNYLKKNKIFDSFNEIKYFFSFWLKYNEERLSQMNFRGKQIFTFPDNKLNDLVQYSPIYTDNKKKNQFQWANVGGTGIDVLIWAYDALLLSIIPDEKNYIDLDIEFNNDNEFNNKSNIKYSFNTLVFNSCINIGDSDSIGMIAGCWYGALNGFNGIDKNKMKNLEFFDELEKLSKNIINDL